MAVLAANFVSKLSFRLLYFSGTTRRRSTSILCLERRDYNTSSFPIRYIPKKASSEVDQHPNNSSTECSQDNRVFSGVTTKFVTDKQPKIQNKIYGHSVSFDDHQGYEVKVNDDTKLIKCEPVEECDMVTEDVGIQHERPIFNKKVQEHKTMMDAQKLALGFLAKRAFTAVELTKKLQAKKVPSNIVGALITDFQNRGLINDSLYAETYSESRWSSSTWGPKRIKQGLFKKGVSKVDAEKAVKSVFEDDQSGGDESKHGMSKVSMDQLLVQTTKQWVRSENAPKETRKARMIRWLQYRGFNWDVISFILRKLESQK
ncbi:regulatory protein RecX family protein [Euphorbia peplus]|nr:regulatory protein RecX family protein [Euphorbia peplus]